VLVSLVARNAPLDTRPDTWVLSFTVGVSLLAGLVFGILPALSASKTDLTTALKEKTSRARSGRLRFGLASALVVSQVALSMVLLAGAGLFARSLMKLQEENVGFNRDNVLLVSLDSRLAGYKVTELSTLYRQILDRVSALPGVQSATYASYSPMGGSSTNSTIEVLGYTPKKDENMDVADWMIGPDYCATIGVPLLMGREVGPRDTVAAQKIVLVNQSFAQFFFHGENPLGKQIRFDDDEQKGDLLEIVGVIGDMKYSNAKEKPVKSVYRPIMQVINPQTYNANLEIRTAGDPATLAPAVRQAIAQVDDKLPIFGVTTLREQVSGNLQQEKLIAELVSFFGLLALLLACIGLYGVMAHGVVRRTREIGIRMALGAERRNIIWMVLRETVVLVLAGVVIGVPAALGATQLIASQLFGTSAADPLTLLVSALLLTAVAMLAGFLPARKASKVNPLIALRYE
jgi:predicted permease